MKNEYGSVIIGSKKIPFKNWEDKEWKKTDWKEIIFYGIILVCAFGYFVFMIVGNYGWIK